MSALDEAEEAFVAFGETFPADAVESRLCVIIRRLAARVQELEKELRVTLDCWKREADWGDGIDEGHVKYFERARVALKSPTNAAEKDAEP